MHFRLNISGELIDKTVGWAVPPKQVLPHENQAVREEGKAGESVCVCVCVCVCA